MRIFVSTPISAFSRRNIAKENLQAYANMFCKFIDLYAEENMPVIVFQRPDQKYVVIAGNQTDEQRTATVKLGKKYLNMTLPARSFNSYMAK